MNYATHWPENILKWPLFWIMLHNRFHNVKPHSILKWSWPPKCFSVWTRDCRNSSTNAHIKARTEFKLDLIYCALLWSGVGTRCGKSCAATQRLLTPLTGAQVSDRRICPRTCWSRYGGEGDTERDSEVWAANRASDLLAMLEAGGGGDERLPTPSRCSWNAPAASSVQEADWSFTERHEASVFGSAQDDNSPPRYVQAHFHFWTLMNISVESLWRLSALRLQHHGASSLS